LIEPQWNELVLVGTISGPHGNRGEVAVRSATDFPAERFQAGRTMYVRRGERIERLTIAAVRFHKGWPILSLPDVAGIGEAEAWAGAELRIRADELTALPEGTFYHHDLVGCRVRTASGEQVGTVSRVEGDAGGSRLVVRGARGEVLVPLAADICRTIDVAGRDIVLEPPEGLLELNEVRHRHHLPGDGDRRAARRGARARRRARRA
jgi:16S rRNA processing protein RimM